MSSLSILVCVPTVPGRQAALVSCARSYERGTYSTDEHDVEINFSVVHDAGSAGEGWQRCVKQGLDWFPETSHVHFSNDDVAVSRGWHVPLIEACDRGLLPAMRVEPAGGHVDEEIFQTHPPLPPSGDHALGDVPRDKNAYFFAAAPEQQPTEDWQEVDHGNLPFCGVDQWHAIGPFPPIHYGSDRFFAERGRRAGMRTVARLDSVVFNYNVNVGRSRGEWTEIDFADFDGVFAVPAYLEGALPLDRPHPLRETPEGLSWVRAWRQTHENPLDTCVDVRLMTDAGRFSLLLEVLERGP